MASAGPKCVAFIDMDCFYVAVERARDTSLRGVPCAVVQYNPYERGGVRTVGADEDRRTASNGSIIAVSYEARARGVTRQMRANEARKQCPELVAVQVPTGFGKADLRIYKDAGDRVVELLGRRADACEKRSVDEVAIDLTSAARACSTPTLWRGRRAAPGPSAERARSGRAAGRWPTRRSVAAAGVSRDDVRQGHAGQSAASGAADDGSAAADDGGGAATTTAAGRATAGAERWDEEERLLVAGAIVVDELRAQVSAELGFTCSGGVARQDARQAGCGLHKPNQQTIVLPAAAAAPPRCPCSVARLGGELGDRVVRELGVASCGSSPRSRRANRARGFGAGVARAHCGRARRA